jgi:hypothetical protein
VEACNVISRSILIHGKIAQYEASIMTMMRVGIFKIHTKGLTSIGDPHSHVGVFTFRGDKGDNGKNEVCQDEKGAKL